MGQNFQPGKWTGWIFFQAVHFKANLSQKMREFSNFSWLSQYQLRKSEEKEETKIKYDENKPLNENITSGQFYWMN